MKKLYRVAWLAILLVGFHTTEAQVLSNVSCLVTAGKGIIPSRDVNNTGFVFSLEPMYHVTPRISVGLRWESYLINNSLSENPREKEVNSLNVSGNYYVTVKQIKVFSGMSLGYFRTPAERVTGDLNNQPYRISTPGNSGAIVTPQIGLQYETLVVQISYSFMNSVTSTTQFLGGHGPFLTQLKSPINNSYWGIHLGYRIGNIPSTN